MSTLPIAEDLDVLEYGVRKIQPGPPFPPGEKLDLRAGTGGFLSMAQS